MTDPIVIVNPPAPPLVVVVDPPGPTGPTGGTGATGSAGATGATGATGDIGRSFRTGVYVPSDWGQFWIPKRDAAATGGKATVAGVGDSILRGYCASDLYATGFMNLLTADLQDRYGDGGSGFQTIKDNPLTSQAAAIYDAQYRVVTVGAWTAYSAGNEGPSGISLHSSTPGDTITYSGLRGTSLTLHTYGGNSAFGIFSYSVDGGAPVTVNTGALNTGNFILKTVASASAGTHTVVCTILSGPVYFHGASAENASGVVVNNHGYGAGTSATAAGGVIANCAWQGGYNYPADLAIYGYSANDAANAIDPETYIHNVRLWLENVRDAGVADGATDLIFLVPHLGKWEHSTRHGSDYALRLRALADNYGAAYVDLWAYFRHSYAYFNSLGGWGSTTVLGATGTDPVHPSDTGHTLYYQALTTLIPQLLG